ncbi:MAG: hypothetical protein A2945_03140 [Candidatus Liptonbacteria bacterium RIFCSPLOWO2_01_FULL_52_25]|uniref:Uncharacterized protein n=1 Tax=Candidatus Liptonbacteria bacterium RIFCSPLOWO2_01_FULL_52_25 TaxID=1798650 RepID=A0A1G2CE16_9BACT|nr:MAG: hypothetical protein A2945_03140 [Candidatus Liptonbacteria bacterium RIFCSPLOWO2_01_FULL_52_25]
MGFCVSEEGVNNSFLAVAEYNQMQQQAVACRLKRNKREEIPMKMHLQWQPANASGDFNVVKALWGEILSKLSYTPRICMLTGEKSSAAWHVVLEGPYFFELVDFSDEALSLMQDRFQPSYACRYVGRDTKAYSDLNLLISAMDNRIRVMRSAIDKLKKTRSLPCLGRKEIAEVRQSLEKAIRSPRRGRPLTP